MALSIIKDLCSAKNGRYCPTGFFFSPSLEVYALADRGARLLIECNGTELANVEWSRRNRLAGRPFIEHQL